MWVWSKIDPARGPQRLSFAVVSNVWNVSFRYQLILGTLLDDPTPSKIGSKGVSSHGKMN